MGTKILAAILRAGLFLPVLAMTTLIIGGAYVEGGSRGWPHPSSPLQQLQTLQRNVASTLDNLGTALR